MANAAARIKTSSSPTIASSTLGRVCARVECRERSWRIRATGMRRRRGDRPLVAAPATPFSERSDPVRLVPRDTDQLGLLLDHAELGPGLRALALAVRAPRRRRIPRETVHECTSCTELKQWSSAGAGARVILRSPA